MQNVHNLNENIDFLRADKKYWKSFIEQDGFEAGVLRLAAGEEDVQSPHKSDEIYLIIEGDGYISIDGKDFQIFPNHSYFVPKGTQHHFHSNKQEIIAFYVLN